MTSKKNNQGILFIARRFPPSVGGMEKFAFELSEELRPKLDDLVLITWGRSNLWLPFVMPMFVIKGLWNIAVKKEIDVIHIQDAMLSPIGWVLHIISRKPYVVVAHGLDITYKSRWYQMFIPFFVKRADALVCISNATANEAINRGVNKSKVFVIPLGVTDIMSGTKSPNYTKEIKKLGIDNKIILLTVGRLVPRKGVYWFIDNVLTGLIKKHPNIVYIVAGEGVERGRISTLIIEKKLENYVKLLGEVSEQLKIGLYNVSDIFVMPNIPIAGDMEGFGIVAHEAAVARIPLVASKLEGIADAIQNNKNGILIHPKNKAEYQKTISGLLKSKDRRKKLGGQAREYTLNEFGWDKIAGMYLDIYKAVNKQTSPR